MVRVEVRGLGINRNVTPVLIMSSRYYFIRTKDFIVAIHAFFMGSFILIFRDFPNLDPVPWWNIYIVDTSIGIAFISFLLLLIYPKVGRWIAVVFYSVCTARAIYRVISFLVSGHLGKYPEILWQSILLYMVLCFPLTLLFNRKNKSQSRPRHALNEQ